MFKRYEIKDKNIGIIETPQRIDISNNDELKKIMTYYVENDIVKIVVDLKNTDFIDSSGLGALVSQIATCRAKGGDIRLASVGEEVNRVLDITQLNKVLRIFSDIDGAISSYE